MAVVAVGHHPLIQAQHHVLAVLVQTELFGL
jgi:hypothetical protein